MINLRYFASLFIYFFFFVFNTFVQVTDCSHLLIFCARNDPDGCVERIIQSADIENIAPPYAASLKTSISSMTKEECQAWASNQAFIALGLGVAAAAELRISSCPMGGFVAADVHKVMQFPDNQWPVAYFAIGSSLDLPETDRTKLRLKTSDLFEFHK
jgi:nitroreductase/dihydropteridine reductase